MSLLRSDRVWLFGGIGLVALLVAAGWFLMINPKYAQASEMQGQVEETTVQLATLRKNLAELKADNAKLSTYKAEESRLMKALPTGAEIPADDIPAFLTQLQVMGMKLEIDVDAYSATGRAKSTVVPTVEELPISLNAKGSVKAISTFINQLQSTQPRAVLVESANLKFDGTGLAELALTLNAFRNPDDSTTTVTTN
ncbi:type 4a pilus biogenesis protein PilO [Actinoplanes sp. NPDC020271]|uniref:type 4a pilus biogenesis protein PilO n=1 Tax=Actinoplanes sp. NPDC020271 TaxID=3363896 RepID=UPI00378F76B9